MREMKTGARRCPGPRQRGWLSKGFELRGDLELSEGEILNIQRTTVAEGTWV
jgi:hypothetical protein